VKGDIRGTRREEAKGWAPPQSWGPPASWHTPHKGKGWGKSQGYQNVQGLECYNGPDWGGMWPSPRASVEGKRYCGMVQDPAGQWIACNPNPPQRTPEDHLQQQLCSLVSRKGKSKVRHKDEEILVNTSTTAPVPRAAQGTSLLKTKGDKSPDCKGVKDKVSLVNTTNRFAKTGKRTRRLLVVLLGPPCREPGRAVPS
jgi:hypothetical protein